jgi:NADH-quinone oxidoreductase subunit L
MEGPTPVSALIHAATMVAAGVYLVVRAWPLYDAVPEARFVLLAAGLVSAMLAASAAIAQTDVKKVLAYSTISQLGFMFVALGAGAWVAALFHLVTHAAFKALLFLGSGSLIHACDTQDLREMGGLKSTMPITFWTWIAGAAALVGMVPFAGFFSKDEIIAAVWHTSPALGLALLVTAGLTAFYVARATRLAFFDSYRGAGHPHEGPATMTLPLLALAVPSALLGWFLFSGHRLATLVSEKPEPMTYWLAGVALAVAGVGLVAGWSVARGGAAGDEAFEESMGGLWGVLRSAWGWDRLVSVQLVNAVVRICSVLWAVVDRLLIDGIAEGAAIATSVAGRALAALQRGRAQEYLAMIALGVVALLAGTRYPVVLPVALGAVALAAAITAVRSR